MAFRRFLSKIFTSQEYNDIFKVLKGGGGNSPNRVMKGQRKTFPRQELKEFITTRHAFQIKEILKLI